MRLDASREQERERWLRASCGLEATMTFASADASARSYFRVHTAHATYILMDDPSPLDESSLVPFLAIQHLLEVAALHVPEIFFYDINLGFALLSDFGDLSYLEALSSDEKRADQLYILGVQSLIDMQSIAHNEVLGMYHEGLFEKELMIFYDYYVQKKDQGALKRYWHTMVSFLTALCSQMPTSFVHRDFHSRNLMYVDNKVGILDFQDAVWGPIGYDVASFLRDAYIICPDEKEKEYLSRFYCHVNMQMSFDAFYRDYVCISFQRHLKIVGIFHRLYTRGKKHYIQDIPRVLSYLKKEADFLKQEESALYDFCSALEDCFEKNES